MSMEVYESTMRQIVLCIELWNYLEKQIEAGQIKDARSALEKRGKSMTYKRERNFDAVGN